jgi:hypothetical protein
MLLIILKGCLLLTLHPLFTPSEYEIVTGIDGVWLAEDNQSSWNFQITEDNVYRLIVVEKDTNSSSGGESHITPTVAMDTSVFKSSFGTINKKLYLDLLVIPKDKRMTMGSIQLASTHSFFLVEIKGDGLLIYPADFKWIEDNLKNKKIKIKHEKLENDNIILTASTKELKQFVKKYSTKGLFPKPLTLNRKKD